MRTIVAGPRRPGITYRFLCESLDKHLPPETSEIVSGHAFGVDTMGEQYAKERGIPVKKFPVFPEDWDRYGKSAGYRRNAMMAEYAEALVAFNNGSRGTGHMIRLMKEKGKKVVVIPIPM